MGNVVSEAYDIAIVPDSSDMDVAFNDDLLDTFQDGGLQQINGIWGVPALQERRMGEFMAGAILSVVHLLDRPDRGDMPGADI